MFTITMVNDWVWCHFLRFNASTFLCPVTFCDRKSGPVCDIIQIIHDQCNLHFVQVAQNLIDWSNVNCNGPGGAT